MRVQYDVSYKGYEFYLDIDPEAGYRERAYAILGLIRNDDQFDIDEAILVDYDPHKDVVTLIQGDYRLNLQVRREATAACEEIRAAGATFQEAS